jgi:hypothetical protein
MTRLLRRNGLFKFSFGLLEQYSFFWWMLYRYYSAKIVGLKMKLMMIVYKKKLQYFSWFLSFFIVTESIMSWDWIMSIDHIGSVLCLDGTFFQVSLLGITVIALVTVF